MSYRRVPGRGAVACVVEVAHTQFGPRCLWFRHHSSRLLGLSMEVEPDALLLPRAELVKTVVVALPMTPDPNLAAADGEGTSDSEEGPRLEYVTHLELNSDNTQLAAALSSLEVNLYTADTMALAGTLKGQTGPLTQLAFAPSDPRSLFSSSEDGTVRWVLEFFFVVIDGGRGRRGYRHATRRATHARGDDVMCEPLSVPLYLINALVVGLVRLLLFHF